MGFIKKLTGGTMDDVRAVRDDPFSDASFSLGNRLSPNAYMKYGMDIANDKFGTPTMSHSDMGKLTAATVALLAGGAALGGGAAGGAAGSSTAGAGSAGSAGLTTGTGGAWGGPASTTGVNAAPSSGLTLGSALKTGGNALGTLGLMQSLFSPTPVSLKGFGSSPIQSSKKGRR